MSFLKVLLCVLLLASPVLSETSQPNCTGVKDFEDCRGDTNEFCPKDILCQCKNEKPFCRCDYYRIGWKEYWYMGPKCNHLWNTLTFILVATLPAAALVILVLVIFLTVYCSKAEKAGRQPKPAPSGAQQNPAFSPDTAADLEHGHHQPAGVRDGGTAQPPGLGESAQWDRNSKKKKREFEIKVSLAFDFQEQLREGETHHEGLSETNLHRRKQRTRDYFYRMFKQIFPFLAS
uniref:Uncharacterized protein n=1 Tax=Ficedula albicollis TaxID=59894 RepID=A0A803V9S3_FICAL